MPLNTVNVINMSTPLLINRKRISVYQALFLCAGYQAKVMTAMHIASHVPVQLLGLLIDMPPLLRYHLLVHGDHHRSFWLILSTLVGNFYIWHSIHFTPALACDVIIHAGNQKQYYMTLVVSLIPSGMIDPMTGEGIHHAMEGGKICAHFLHEVFAVGNFDCEVMKEFQNRWMQAFGSDYTW